MIRKKKVLVPEEMPEFKASIEALPEDSRIFVDRSLEIAHHIFQLMEQKGMKQKDLAIKLGKSEAEVSKWLAGMHNYTLRSLAKLEVALGSEVITVPKQTYIHVPVTSRTGNVRKEQLLQPMPEKTSFKTAKIVAMPCREEHKHQEIDIAI